MKAGFDYAELTTTDGTPARRLTEREFHAMPLADRVRAILGGRLRFFRGDRQIAMKEALGEM